MSQDHVFIEILAQELHRQYRAAEKATYRKDMLVRRVFHDHGWSNCAMKDYFRKRALLVIKRSTNLNATTLGEAERELAEHTEALKLVCHGKEHVQQALKAARALIANRSKEQQNGVS